MSVVVSTKPYIRAIAISLFNFRDPLRQGASKPRPSQYSRYCTSSLGKPLPFAPAASQFGDGESPLETALASRRSASSPHETEGRLRFLDTLKYKSTTLGFHPLSFFITKWHSFSCDVEAFFLPMRFFRFFLSR